MNEVAADGTRRIPGHISIADAIRMKARVSAATWQSEMLCLRARRTHTVYPEFGPAVHVVGQEVAKWQSGKVAKWEGGNQSASAATLAHSATPPLCHSATSPATLVAGIDFGYRAPTVILWATLDEGVLTVFAERAETEMILATHVRALTEAPWGVPAWIGIDPAGNSRNAQTGISAADVLRKAGLKVRARRGPTHPGLELVRARLKPADGSQPRLLIHKRCTNLIEALEKYHYSETDPTSLEPVKDGPDHAADALRYLVLNLDNPVTVKSWNYLRSNG